MPSAGGRITRLQARPTCWLTRRRVIDFGRWATCCC